MVGTDDLRQLLTATTRANVKTILVGDAHQLAPVKARGGMFAQLCADLPWTQHLSEVWRMRNPEERTASLALRDGGPEPVRKAIDWYRDHDRLRCGEAIAMATDALAGYRRDVAVGKDALLLCDTTEMADALNRRIHDDTIPADAPTVTAARGQRIAAGDLILSRRNDPTIEVWQPADGRPGGGSGPQRGPVARRRDRHRRRIGLPRNASSDQCRAVFDGDYLREHVTHGYATTVHSAQGVTADTTHAVLGESTTRSMLYVAMTRARDANTAYLYERTTEQEYGPRHPTVRTSCSAAPATRPANSPTPIITMHDDVPVTAHQVADATPHHLLPERVASLLTQRHTAVQNRRTAYTEWQTAVHERDIAMAQGRARFAERSHSRSRSRGRDNA